MSPAQAASFACNKQRGEVERLICSDVELSTLDDQLALEFNWIQLNEERPGAVLAEQKRWLNVRNRCGDIACIKAAYLNRLISIGGQRTDKKSTSTLSFEQCRTSTIAIVADCIEANIYNPCDDATSFGAWGDCGAPFVIVAERRIRRAELEIINFAKSFPGVEITPVMFTSADRRWMAFRAKHCTEMNADFLKTIDAHLHETVGESSETGQKALGQPMSQCLKSITEQRAEALESFLGVAGMKPYELDRRGLIEYLEYRKPKK